VRINSQYYANSAPAEARTTSLQRSAKLQRSGEAKRQTPPLNRINTAQRADLAQQQSHSRAEPQSAGEAQLQALPVSKTNTLQEGTHGAQAASNLQTDKKPETERPPSVAVMEGESEPATKVTAKAFVSFCSSDNMLVARVLIAGELQEKHLDSCASHCFVSGAMSHHLTSRGYPPVVSPICFEVKQGNPLCDTNLVHFAPLSIVLESGAICTWDNCLFLVADAGAPIILCYSLLRLGGVLSYEPPHGYERMLKLAAGAANANQLSSRSKSGTQAQHFATMRGGTYYHAPSSTTPPIAPHQLPAKCLATEAESNSRPARSESTTTGIRSGKRGVATHYLDTEIPFLESEKRSRATSQPTPKKPSDATEFLYSNFEPLIAKADELPVHNRKGVGNQKEKGGGVL
jgi:hypothetical protein